VSLSIQKGDILSQSSRFQTYRKFKQPFFLIGALRLSGINRLAAPGRAAGRGSAGPEHGTALAAALEKGVRATFKTTASDQLEFPVQAGVRPWLRACARRNGIAIEPAGGGSDGIGSFASCRQPCSQSPPIWWQSSTCRQSSIATPSALETYALQGLVCCAPVTTRTRIDTSANLNKSSRSRVRPADSGRSMENLRISPSIRL
jgi:hypothetical protein